ncbi:hypothetical protein ACFQT0_04395 [Hymenobacter humi]|uniref:Uncharacterized protein n=1 Tax=Hymenobacter humi TaxID=1411620 RepID=A0ABW2U272_9BACT
MKTLAIALSAVFCLLALRPAAFGQSAAADESVAVATAKLQEQYAASFGGHPQLYNGPEYVDYAKRYHARTGHQFFLSPDMQTGRVDYNGQSFQNIRLAYDVVLDQVVLSHPTSPLLLRLINEKARGFTVNNHSFIRLVADSASGAVIRTGYYEVLVDSSVQVLAKRAKRQQEHLQQQQVDVEFTDTDRLFIRKAGQYYAIKRKSQALRLFADQKPALQKFMQEQKLSFRKADFEASVVQLARYYCSLPTAK